jgi:hypothetical protein
LPNPNKNPKKKKKKKKRQDKKEGRFFSQKNEPPSSHYMLLLGVVFFFVLFRDIYHLLPILLWPEWLPRVRKRGNTQLALEQKRSGGGVCL